MTLIVNVSDLDDDYEKSTIARIIAQTVVVNTGYTSDCYEWTGGIDKRPWGGYGLIHFDGQQRLVHRVAWKILRSEPLIDGLTLDHLCEHKRCWNVEHLEQVTHAVNTERYWEHWRQRRAQLKK